ncbi:MAG: glycosyltransferase family 4 protein [Candidatus Moranbacteria bacterium]|jgi:glycosyltransferase involved in cell wall biosynthesis|nr:glycosyltransferase family 4 protein [Candidatus Moranbacteria bacterium]
MKICLVTEHFPPHIGGVEIAFHEYAKILSQKGHTVRVITSNSGGITGKINSTNNLEIYHLKCKSFFGHPIISKKELKKHIEWADIVHTTTFTAALPAVNLSCAYKKPCVIMVHEVLKEKWFQIEKNPVKALAFLIFEKFVLSKKYTAWHTISQATRNDLEKYKIPKEKIKLIYHGIDYNIWNNHIKEKSLNELFNIDKDDLIFFYSGRPGKTKGTFLLLEAINKIRNDIPKNFKFGFMLSKDPEEERISFEKIVRTHKLNNLIKISDSLPYQEIPAYRKNSFAFIVPSLTEGFGFSAAEASALNIPIISSDTGSLPEVTSGKLLIFKSGDSNDLSRKILMATQNKFNIIPEKKFYWNDSIIKIEKLYNELLKK